MASRSAARTAFPPDVRVQLAEDDLDDLESEMQKVNDRLGKILGVCVSILVAVTTSCVMLAINLAVQK